MNIDIELREKQLNKEFKALKTYEDLNNFIEMKMFDDVNGIQYEMYMKNSGYGVIEFFKTPSNNKVEYITDRNLSEVRESLVSNLYKNMEVKFEYKIQKGMIK